MDHPVTAAVLQVTRSQLLLANKVHICRGCWENVRIFMVHNVIQITPGAKNGGSSEGAAVF